jgi:C4-dicarboxylate-specific signal transduction histidine kinase
MYHIPIALWQTDASHMGRIYKDVRARGVRDFAGYLDEHPELVSYAADSVIVTEVNGAAVELFGGNNAADLLGPVGYMFAGNPETLRRVMIGRFNGQRNHEEITRIRTFDGQLLDVQMKVTYPNPPVELDVTIFSMENITERIATEAQLRQLQADFAHAARISTLGELTTSIAHEINQPLSAIVTNAETSLRWLSRPEPNVSKVEQLTGRIAASAQRASEIVQRIRGMAGKHRPERVALDLNEVVREALLFVRHEMETHLIEITIDFSSKLPVVVGDRVQLQQVIVNFLINSIQAIQHQGRGARRIWLSTEAKGDCAVTFRVRDSGTGISEGDLDRIFEGFFTTKESGMGIGLAICQSIIGAHGGKITAQNAPDGGADFSFTLPAGADSPE